MSLNYPNDAPHEFNPFNIRTNNDPSRNILDIYQQRIQEEQHVRLSQKHHLAIFQGFLWVSLSILLNFDVDFERMANNSTEDDDHDKNNRVRNFITILAALGILSSVDGLLNMLKTELTITYLVHRSQELAVAQRGNEISVSQNHYSCDTYLYLSSDHGITSASTSNEREVSCTKSAYVCCVGTLRDIISFPWISLSFLTAWGCVVIILWWEERAEKKLPILLCIVVSVMFLFPLLFIMLIRLVKSIKTEPPRRRNDIRAHADQQQHAEGERVSALILEDTVQVSHQQENDHLPESAVPNPSSANIVALSFDHETAEAVLDHEVASSASSRDRLSSLVSPTIATSATMPEPLISEPPYHVSVARRWSFPKKWRKEPHRDSRRRHGVFEALED